MSQPQPPENSASDEMRHAFRNALGAFATGVTIATTLDSDGQPVGVTANSFNSVSLDPPLVLWSLAKASFSRPAFADSGHFAVHVLTAEQDELSDRFARTGEDKFANLTWSSGKAGSPVLSDYAARFECETRHQYDGGDHIIMVGEVIHFDARDEAPLLFHAGRYAEHRPKPIPGAKASNAAALEQADEIAALIAQAHDALAGGKLNPAQLAEMMDAPDRAELQRLLQKLV